MSQSRFSIVLVGVSALLRRPLVSRLRPADGERSPWVVFAARGCRFDSGFRSVVGLRVHCFRFSARTALELPSSGWPSGSLFPLFGMRRFGVAAGRVRSSAFRFGDSARRVGLRVHCFRFSACTDSELPSAGWPSGSLLPIFGTRRFGVAAGRLAFGLPLRRLPSAGWPSGSLLPLFGTHRFGVAAGRVRSSAFRFGDCPRRVGSSARWLAFGFTASAFRHAPLWSCPRRVGLRAHCFRFSARTDPHRRAAEARTDGAQRHDTCFTSKHLSQHVNLPHRTP